MKYLAIQCNAGVFQGDRVPIFITLKNLAEAEGQPSLLEYITQFFSDCDIGADQAALLLKRGRALILLDGLDEVKEEDDRRISKQVRDFSEKFCTNQFVITCRIAARKYIFDKFTEVEIADFDGRQIATFVQKWFQDKELAKADGLTQQLRENRPILELATNPLLLTLLCLVFEESAKFPTNRSELYEEGIDILLKRWDETREIERTQIYKNLSVQRKKDLLSKIALITFERGDYFFKQKELEQHISDYICNLPNAQNDQEALPVDGEAVLKSIEAQHGLLVERAKGIYSFSHLTLQEYFTAKQIVECSKYSTLERLASHLMDSRWREVLLLVTEMLPSADKLLQLMQRQIDRLISEDRYLQKFLTWVSKKSRMLSVPYPLYSIRVFYFEAALLLDDSLFGGEFEGSGYFFDNPDDAYSISHCLKINWMHKLTYWRESEIDKADNLDPSLEIYHTLARILFSVRYLETPTHYDAGKTEEDYCTLSCEIYADVTLAIDCCICLGEKRLQQLLQKLQSQLLLNLPHNRCRKWRDEELKRVIDWWNDNGAVWFENLRVAVIEHCNMGEDWQFSDEQKELLKHYHEAHLFLVECLNTACNVSPEVQAQIKETLLLPVEQF